MKFNKSGHICKSLKNIKTPILGKKREEKGKYEMSVVSRFPGGGTIVLVRTALVLYKPQRKAKKL